ncbi:methyltransferase domain-containing protein [Amycolatopsis sp. NBC_01480]|uniref:methyltransferase domain-containing protein n=1 Tax=Amycolatopsis sp. NBC_01480 TaxID=2903562 RepID=UPI002E289EB6|nr:methyltransferase domain-containing protein [Amycolatopsis sp. NBC_01480]
MAESYGVQGPDKVTYYAQVAASDAGRGYKRQVLEALDLRPGQTVLDVGCGPGTDLPGMADAVTASGVVIGVDLEPSMVGQARRRVADRPWVEVREGDAHALPVPPQSVDRARADRMVQHVADPAAVFAEFRRVLRPGGVACVAEPDWDSLVVDPGDLETNRAFNRFVCATMVRNATVGRQAARLAQQAGLEVLDVITSAPVFRDFALADRILGLSRNTERAIRADQLDRETGTRWLAEIAAGPFLASTLVFLTVVRRPA